jgi:hypothetical protein
MWGHLVSKSSLQAISMGVLDPRYAFTATEAPELRHYVSLNPPVPGGARGVMMMPFFNVTSVKWFDTPLDSYRDDPADGGTLFLGNATTLEAGLKAWAPGSLGFWRDVNWNTNDSLAYTDEVYEGKRNISLHVGSLWDDWPMSDGTLPTQATPCQTKYPEFEQAPDVKQFRKDISVHQFRQGIYVGDV